MRLSVSQMAKLTGVSVRTLHYYNCTREILAGLGQMYGTDERFRRNLDRFGEGTAAFLSAAIAAYTA